MGSNKKSRTLQNGFYYHIYNRGNRRDNLAWDEEDKNYFAEVLYELFAHHKDESLFDYNLMDNHYHMTVLVNNSKDFIGLMRSFGIRTAKYYNKKYKSVGHLCQGKYHFKEVDSVLYLLSLSRYISSNHLSLKEIITEDDFLNYPWSSLGTYCGADPNKLPRLNSLLKTDLIMEYFNFDPAQYLKYVKDGNLFREVSPKFRERLEKDALTIISKQLSFPDFNIRDSKLGYPHLRGDL